MGITVPYYDSVAWEKAIRFIVSNPEEAEEMGRKARQLAEKSFNLDICTHEVAEAIKKFEKKKEKEVRGEKLEEREEKVVQKVQEVQEVQEVQGVQQPLEPTIFDQPVEPQKPELAPEPAAPKLPEFRVSKEIEDFYATFPLNCSTTS